MARNISADPINAMFFVKLTISIIFAIGSWTAQKLCMMNETGRKKSTRARTPMGGWTPSRMLSPSGCSRLRETYFVSVPVYSRGFPISRTLKMLSNNKTNCHCRGPLRILENPGTTCSRRRTFRRKKW